MPGNLQLAHTPPTAATRITAPVTLLHSATKTTDGTNAQQAKEPQDTGGIIGTPARIRSDYSGGRVIQPVLPSETSRGSASILLAHALLAVRSGAIWMHVMDGGTEIVGALHRFSVRDYRRMGETGLFDQARVELVRGAVIDMAPIGTPHLRCVNRLNRLFAPLMVNRLVDVSVQNSIRLDDRSEPEPDIVLLILRDDETVHPSPGDVLLVIEVADRTLAYDRSVKVPLYAEAGLNEYWIVNLIDRIVEVYRDPSDGSYGSVQQITAGPLPIVALPTFEISVEQVFGF